MLGTLGDGWEQAEGAPVQREQCTHVEDVRVVVVVLLLLLLPMGLIQHYCRQSEDEWADNGKESLIVQGKKKLQNREASLSLPKYLGQMLIPTVLHGFASDVLLMLLCR